MFDEEQWKFGHTGVVVSVVVWLDVIDVVPVVVREVVAVDVGVEVNVVVGDVCSQAESPSVSMLKL